jgi:hypothetical protein
MKINAGELLPTIIVGSWPVPPITENIKPASIRSRSNTPHRLYLRIPSVPLAESHLRTLEQAKEQAGGPVSSRDSRPTSGL